MTLSTTQQRTDLGTLVVPFEQTIHLLHKLEKCFAMSQKIRFFLLCEFQRWFAKKVDYTTPMYNDSTLYREEYSYFHNISNTYRSNLYNTRDGIPIRNLSLISQPTRYGYLDPYVNNTGAPVRPIFQNWTYIRSDRREFR